MRVISFIDRTALEVECDLSTDKCISFVFVYQLNRSPCQLNVVKPVIRSYVMSKCESNRHLRHGGHESWPLHRSFRIIRQIGVPINQMGFVCMEPLYSRSWLCFDRINRIKKKKILRCGTCSRVHDSIIFSFISINYFQN